MKRILVGICIAAFLAGCASKGGEPPKAAVEQRDITDQQKTDAQRAAELEANRKAEEARRAAQDQERRRQQEEAARRAAADQPVVQPLPAPSLTQQALSDPATALKDPASPLSRRSVYYDFDMYDIRGEFQPMIEAHAKFLIDNSSLRIRVEGNCDERGSREYNLALGQRRADAVKRAMTLLGVPANRIETVSFGAEKPKVAGSTEEAWAENRRSDIVYIGIDAPQ